RGRRGVVRGGGGGRGGQAVVLLPGTGPEPGGDPAPRRGGGRGNRDQGHLRAVPDRARRGRPGRTDRPGGRPSLPMSDLGHVLILAGRLSPERKISAPSGARPRPAPRQGVLG